MVKGDDVVTIPMQTIIISAHINPQSLPDPIKSAPRDSSSLQQLTFMIDDGTQLSAELSREAYRQIYQAVQRHYQHNHHIALELTGVLHVSDRTITHLDFVVHLDPTSPSGMAL